MAHYFGMMADPIHRGLQTSCHNMSVLTVSGCYKKTTIAKGFQGSSMRSVRVSLVLARRSFLYGGLPGVLYERVPGEKGRASCFGLSFQPFRAAFVRIRKECGKPFEAINPSDGSPT